jgi:hypothetical protein
LDGEVRETPSENYERFSRGEQNIDVGEGQAIVRTQEVMLPIQSGRPEGETEILRTIEEVKRSDSFQEEVRRSEVQKSESSVRNGGPRPGCKQVDQRPCQSELTGKAIGASLGRTMPLRTLSISKTKEIETIWVREAIDSPAEVREN